MNKPDLIDKIWNKVDLKKFEVEQVVDALFEVIEQAIVDDENVTISGFGSFDVRERMSRKDPSQKVKGVHFECSRVLKKKVNK